MDKDEFLMEQWKMAAEFHRHQDDLVWRRFDYVIGFTVFLLTAFGYVWHVESEAWFKLITVSLLSAIGIFISDKWSRLHTRTQLYHALRVTQAKNIEKALAERLDLQKPLVTGLEGSVTFYGPKPNDLPETITTSIRHSAFGRNSSLNTVFRISRALVLLWIILLMLSLLVICIRLLGPNTLPSWLRSTI